MFIIGLKYIEIRLWLWLSPKKVYLSLLNDKDYMMMKEKPYFLCYFI